ncbi:MAG: heme o synthase [Acidimicrobiia bacterium]
MSGGTEVVDVRAGVADVTRALGRWRDSVAAYFALTKPRIIELLLITTVPAMVVAAGGWPGTWLVVATLVGGSLSAGGANALNSYLDRDIDRVMRRTARRPLPTARVEPARAALFGWVLGAAGFAWLWLAVNLLAAAISTAALLFYVLVYTIGLKRATVENIVIGGAAGAAPPLVGWAAVTGELSLAAWIMFAIVFYWTPPHFWALALRYRDDYARAGVPMLPVVAGVEVTTRRILVYSGALVLVSLLMVPAAGLRWVYLAAAVGLGGWLVVEALRLARRPRRAMTMFGYTNLYLAALFAAMWVDVAAL